MQTPQPKRWSSIVGRIALILVILLVGLVVGSAGIPKLLDSPQYSAAFMSWGYPHWFMVVIGLVETGGTLLLFGSVFVRRLALPGALLLTGDMVGAAFTRAIHADWRNFLLPCLLLLFLSLIGWAERKSWLGMLPRFKAAS